MHRAGEVPPHSGLTRSPAGLAFWLCSSTVHRVELLLVLKLLLKKKNCVVFFFPLTPQLIM